MRIPLTGIASGPAQWPLPGEAEWGAHCMESASELELRLRAALLEAQSEASPDGILVVGMDGRILSYNRNFLRMWQIPDDAIFARSDEAAIASVWDRLVSPEEFRARIEQLHRNPDEVSRDEIRLRDGSTFHRYSSPIRTSDGVTAGRIWFFRDVTEQRRAEDRLRFLAEASSLLASSLEDENALGGVVRLAVPTLADVCTLHLVSEDGQIRRVEEAACDPAAVERLEALRGSSSLAREALGPAGEALRSGLPVLVGTGGEGVAGAMLAVPLVARRHGVGVLSLAHLEAGRTFTPADVDTALELGRRLALAVDNQRLYRTAERANRAKSDFLAVMSHELRTPLNAITGYADLWLMGLPETLSEPMRTQVERVALSARHLHGLIEAILTFSRIEAGEEEAHLTETSLAELTGSVVAQIEPLAVRRGLAVRVEEVGPSAFMLTDAGKARQILLHLLSNAVKFTERGEVALAVTTGARAVEFRVRDTGIGVPAEHLEHIFEPFWQVEQTVTRRAEGTGLGLSVARRLARVLGGEVSLESTSREGSTFLLRLPATPSVEA